MIKISDTVRELVNSSEVVSEALRAGILNMSAYAQMINPAVVQKAKKPVKKGSIVAVLARMGREVEQLVPEVQILDLTVKAPLIEVVYEKNRNIVNGLKDLHNKIKIGASEFMAITQGTEEINIMVSEKEKEAILTCFGNHKPKTIISGLVAVSVRFDPKYIEVPNVIYALIRKLAARKINIIEIVSTYTELTVLINRKDLEGTLGSFG